VFKKILQILPKFAKLVWLKKIIRLMQHDVKNLPLKMLIKVFVMK